MSGSTKKKEKKKAFLYAACFAKEQQNSKARRKIVAKGTEALHHSNTRHLKPFFLVCRLDLLFKNRFINWSHSLCDRNTTHVVLSLFIYIYKVRLGILQCHAMLRYVAVEQKQTLMLKLRGGCLELCKQFASQVRAISQQRSCHMAVKHHTGASSTACYCQHLYRNLRYKSWEATEKEKKKSGYWQCGTRRIGWAMEMCYKLLHT